ncbi:MAG: ElyC/SanA/YdcF family protein [Aquificaceae bacterium]
MQEKSFRRVALVTSAYHMPRAVNTFRRAGLGGGALPYRFQTG